MRWYLNIEGQNSGPYDDATIVQWIQAGQLSAAWICQEGGTDWVALGAHPPFAEALLAMQGQAAAPPTPGPAGQQQPPLQQTTPASQARQAPQTAPEMGGSHHIADPAMAATVAQEATPRGGASSVPSPAAGGAQATAAPLDHGPLEQDSISKLFGRIPLLFKNPSDYWSAVRTLEGGVGELLLPTVLLLAGASAVFGLLGNLVRLRTAIGLAPSAMIAGLLFAALLSVVGSVGVWLLMAVLIDAFAGVFEAQKDGDVARKLAFGALTPMWLAGVLGLIPVPVLSGLLILVAFGYGCFLMVVGLPKLNNTPKAKAIGYTAVVMGMMLIVSFIINVLAACPVGCAAGCAAKARLERMYRLDPVLRRRGEAPKPPRKLEGDQRQAQDKQTPPKRKSALALAASAHYAPAFALPKLPR
ncbi:MAG: hypothetical protein CSA65_05795 [Proteobacteria bacterium]|nr:MAG: hypothetical protein CSB49_02135 [Pseudomonadota bacterium]PIE18229.1 MAG: hypothetical protein CSA65_05795 [Pseudomonadota bacterium]